GVFCRWPGEDEGGVVGFTAQRIVTGAKRPADDDSQFRHDRITDDVHKLGPGANDPSLLGLFADHESLDILKKDDRYARLIAVHHEAGSFVGCVWIDHAADLEFAGGGTTAMFLIGDNADGVATDFSVGSDQREAVFGFVFLKRIWIEDAL